MVADKTPLVLAISGASGAAYGLSLAGKIVDRGVPIHLLISPVAEKIISDETGCSCADWIQELSSAGDVTVEDSQDFTASISSGSYRTRGMIIAPCSMGTLGRIAGGISSSLIDRAADVCLKERRRLILLARETPLSLIHLENMLKLTQAGAVVMPPVPALYTSPSSIQEMIDQTADRVLDLFDLSPPGAFRWKDGASGND
jgi:4-hydroxy-3-polyprenylbenzoate decarboxylase